MEAEKIYQDTEAYRDSIATVDQKGKRIWMYPKKPKGPFTKARTWLSFALLAFLFGMPWIKFNGEPLFLFNVLERRFILFGVLFTPQDFHLFVLAMITFMVFVILFTVVFGRIFCGWFCPQTIFMEMVFRKIEYWLEGDANAQRRLNKAPWTWNKFWRKGLKQGLFFAIAVLVSNTFLAWIIGAEEVIQIATEPVSLNLGGFVAMILFSFAFYFVFSYMREQVCIAVCPYGRLQGVLLDKNSIVVAYDFVRGEPRGKIKKNRKKPATPKPIAEAKSDQNPLVQMQASVETATKEISTADCKTETQTDLLDLPKQLGDCIDCKLCIAVCPTGIDIRNGTQLECINCTACIDACDEVMEKVKRPKGLIRYDSLKGIEEGRKKILTPRVMAYSAVLLVLIVVQAFLLSSRTDVETLLLRTPGMLYQKVDDQTISNLYNYQIINKTKEEYAIEFKLVESYGTIKLVGKEPLAKMDGVTEGALFIEMPTDKLTNRKTKLEIEVYSNGELIDKISTNFLGPVK